VNNAKLKCLSGFFSQYANRISVAVLEVRRWGGKTGISGQG